MSDRTFQKPVSEAVRRANPAIFGRSLAATAAGMQRGDYGPPTKAEAGEEKALQAEFENWLRQHDYLFRREPMHRATMAPAGWPDFQVILPGGRAVFFEYKTATGRLSPDQTAWHKRAQERGVPVFVVRSLAFAVDCLRQVKKHAANWTQTAGE